MAEPGNGIGILVVDDDEYILRALHAILKAMKYEVQVAPNCAEGMRLAVEHVPDLVVLDLMLPDGSGLEMCKNLRTWYSGPILILSAKNRDTDKVAALDLGADDYLTKPFSSAELLARVRALLRRSHSSDACKSVVTSGDLTIDLAHRRVTLSDTEVRLTPFEYELLAFMARYPNRVVTNRMLMERLWGRSDADDTKALRVHVMHIRRKIEYDPQNPRYLINEPGVGYRFLVD